MSARVITLTAPLAGWSTALEEAPDEVFATRMLGDGVAIDPTEGRLHAPCDGELVLVAAARHALTVRSASGCDILLHVGIDTVGLAGAGFEAHVPQGARVRAGELLLSFDLDLLARRARSLLTPVIVTTDGGFRIARRTLGREVAVGEFLMEIVAAAAAPGPRAAPPEAPAQMLSRHLTVAFEHGLHARPAAVLAGSLKRLAADVRVLARGGEANARSTIALMGLGVQHADEIEIRASGPDAGLALDALSAILTAAEGPARAPGAAAAAPAAARASSPAPAANLGGLTGLIASRGLAVGQAVQLRRPEIEVAEAGEGADQENAALDRARHAVRSRLQAAASGTATRAAGEIAAAHLELLEDPELLAEARSLTLRGKSAGFAWRAALRAAARTLSALGDPRLRERADDLLDLESQVLQALRGAGLAPATPLPRDAIVIARELLPSQLVALDATRLAGLALAAGGTTSHVAILAAAMGIPALVALGPAALAVTEGSTVVLDAEHGLLEIDPPPARLGAARAQLAARRARRSSEQAAAQRECRTADGVRIEVFANVGSVAEAHAAVRNGAEGCGLLRTEFLFLERASAPDESEQAEEYQRIADALGERPLVIRTLDAGGDKPIAYLPQPPEENPALGLRGVRTSLANPALLRTQLSAILRVRPRGRCRILLPMITEPAEVHAVRALLQELDPGGEPAIEVGVMIETPASALLADRLAAVSDFLSIGTNDLTQYTLAMDRGNPLLAPRLDALHPAILRLIRETAAAGDARGRPTAVCGGLASEPLAAPLLIGLGVVELSAVGAVIPQLKACVAGVTLAECRALAARALTLESAAAVRELVRRELPAASAGAAATGASS